MRNIYVVCINLEFKMGTKDEGFLQVCMYTENNYNKKCRMVFATIQLLRKSFRAQKVTVMLNRRRGLFLRLKLYIE